MLPLRKKYQNFKNLDTIVEYKRLHERVTYFYIQSLSEEKEFYRCTKLIEIKIE